MRYVTDACHPKEPTYQIRIQYDLRQMSNGCLTLVALVPELP